MDNKKSRKTWHLTLNFFQVTPEHWKRVFFKNCLFKDLLTFKRGFKKKKSQGTPDFFGFFHILLKDLLFLKFDFFQTFFFLKEPFDFLKFTNNFIFKDLLTLKVIYFHFFAGNSWQLILDLKSMFSRIAWSLQFNF